MKQSYNVREIILNNSTKLTEYVVEIDSVQKREIEIVNKNENGDKVITVVLLKNEDYYYNYEDNALVIYIKNTNVITSEIDCSTFRKVPALIKTKEPKLI
ncbi:MAG: hypothetical protein Q4G04_06045 [bacterium]|nr:hypothetical protein [bacterium]